MENTEAEVQLQFRTAAVPQADEIVTTLVDGINSNTTTNLTIDAASISK